MFVKKTNHSTFLISLCLAVILCSCAPNKPVPYTDIISESRLSRNESRAIKVLATAPWRDSGILVSKGGKYKITASGRWRTYATCGYTGPDGIGTYNVFCWDLGFGRVIPGYPHTALIAKIHSDNNDGTPFGIGNFIEFEADRDGILYFRVNEEDKWLGDGNEGEMNVMVTKLQEATNKITLTKYSDTNVQPSSPNFIHAQSNWALIIGISKYRYSGQNGLSNLIFADDDAKAFARSLHNLGWSDSHIKLLVNEQASQRNIMIALESWLTKAGPNDQVVLFWAGHGFPDPQDPEKVYFACYDTDINIPATGYRMDKVRAALEERKAKNVILLADTCHAGKLITRGDGNRGISIVPNINKMAREQKVPKGWIFMVGADTDRQAIEHTSWTNGAFTHSLIKGLSGEADGFQSAGAKDGVVTMGELKDYMKTSMPDETQKVLGVAKHPVITTSTGDPDIWKLTLQVSQ